MRGAAGTTRRGAGGSIRRQGEVTAKVLVSGTGPLVRAEDPGLPGLDDVRRAGVPLRALGPHRRPARQAGRRRSAPARRRSSTCPKIAPDVEQLYVFQRTPPWVMPHSATADHARRAAAVPRAFPPLQRAVRGGDLRGARAAGARLRQAARGDEAARASRAPGTASARSSDPELIAPSDAPLHRSAASASCRPTTGIRRSRATTSSSSPTASREVRERSIVTTDGRELEVDALHLRHRLPRHRHAGRAARPRARRPHAGRRLGRLAAARTWARPSPASRTSSSCSARTPGSGTARWST